MRGLWDWAEEKIDRCFICCIVDFENSDRRNLIILYTFCGEHHEKGSLAARENLSASENIVNPISPDRYLYILISYGFVV
jgi:hypothetical protein